MDPISPTGSGPQQPIQPPVTLPGSMQPGWLPPPAPGYRWDADRRTGQWAQVPLTPPPPARPPTPRERWGWFAAEPGEPSVAGLHPRWLLVALAVLILLPVCTCISLQSLFGPRYTYSSPSVVYIAPTETPLPTLPPTPTNTPTPPDLRGASIGGTADGFAGKYGPPLTDSSYGDYYTYHTWGSGLDPAMFIKNTVSGVDGKAHVTDLVIELPAYQQWEQIQEQTICGFLRPDDAKQVDEKVLNSGAGYQVDEVVYRSSALAATLPQMVFVDSQKQPVQPGTFVIDYLPDIQSGATTPYTGGGHCELSVGRY